MGTITLPQQQEALWTDAQHIQTELIEGLSCVGRSVIADNAGITGEAYGQKQ